MSASGDLVLTNSMEWSQCKISQPLKMINQIPDDILVIIGTTNQHDGEIFVHSAFQVPILKPIYLMCWSSFS